MFEEVVHTVSAKFQHEILKLEIQALGACMDGVGWTLPENKFTKDTLEHMMLYRLVQPVEQSGTAVREAFVFQGHLNSLPPGVRRQSEEDDDDDDMMDMAA